MKEAHAGEPAVAEAAGKSLARLPDLDAALGIVERRSGREERWPALLQLWPTGDPPARLVAELVRRPGGIGARDRGDGARADPRPGPPGRWAREDGADR